MGSLDNAEEFLNYINNPLSRASIDLIYSSNNVVFERVDLYRDFTHSLFDLIFDTYLGDDCMNLEACGNHFNWAWNKTIDNFIMEGIVFGENQDLYDYYLAFVLEVYYKNEEKEDNPKICGDILKLWDYTFNYHTIKTNSDMDNFIDIYKMFDKSLKKGKKS